MSICLRSRAETDMVKEWSDAWYRGWQANAKRQCDRMAEHAHNKSGCKMLHVTTESPEGRGARGHLSCSSAAAIADWPALRTAFSSQYKKDCL
eukprot:2532492-Rhodomonas_salina.1